MEFLLPCFKAAFDKSLCIYYISAAHYTFSIGTLKFLFNIFIPIHLLPLARSCCILVAFLESSFCFDIKEN